MTASKIMIVEDETIVGMDLTHKLERLGYLVAPEVIRYGGKALGAAEKHQPDLVLMDIRLKGDTDGIEAACHIRENLGLPVVFLTAYTDDTTLFKAKKTEPFGYLKKPVRAEDLKIVLEMTLYKAAIDKQLRESELRFRTVAEFTHDWETWTGPGGDYLYSSPSCLRITGYSGDAFTRDPSFFANIIYPDDRKRFERFSSRHLQESRKATSLEFRIIRKDGEIRWIDHVCQPVFDSGGRYLGQRASSRDITKRKLLECRLSHKVEELQEALDSIKTLKGLIPICSHCKNIRDDHGYWNYLESYLQTHADVTFSHSLCPSCMDDLYGEEDWYQNIKTKF
ncbi:MAG: PAS domain-containing protein [Desulfobacterales bacterium]|nr:PAS domain-containing protein [Desulfobacterales bacterium]